MEALAYLQELHQDPPTQAEAKKGIVAGSDRFIYVGPQADDGKLPLIYMKRVSDLVKYAKEMEQARPNMFYSLNAFWKVSRKQEDIRHFRALYVDLDCYSVGLTPMEVLEQLENNYFGERIPEPNAITFTGRGLNCIWFIEKCPKGAMKTWQRVGQYLLDTLKCFGADEKCTTDASRVFRLPGSINPKSGEKVQLKLRHENKYSLRDLHVLYTPWEESSKRKVAHFKRKSLGNAVKANRFTWASLNTARLQDIRTLQSLRNENGIAEGYRETALMLFHYYAMCQTGDEKKAEEMTLHFNSQFLKPVRTNAIKDIARYSKGHAIKWSESFANLQLSKVKPNTLVHNSGLLISNEKLISMLGITAEEQQQMLTVIGEEEYKRRERLRAERNRRKAGQVERAEYLAQQKSITDDKLEQLRQLLADNPKAKKTHLAKELGVGREYIYDLLKKL